MSFRIEKKIFVKKENYFDFKKYLSEKGIIQLYQPRKINSVYFDNEQLGMYHDSIEGLLPRKKIRIRNYPDDNQNNFFVEYKISSVEGRFKTNRKISTTEKRNSIEKGFFDQKYGICKPTLNVAYNREYLIKDDVRITMDTNIDYSYFKKKQKIKDTNIVVELKSSIKKDIDELFNQFPFQEIRFSKYCNGIEILNLY
mgnify:FL=1